MNDSTNEFEPIEPADRLSAILEHLRLARALTDDFTRLADSIDDAALTAQAEGMEAKVMS